MKKLICLISLLILLTGCNSENNENDVENKQEELAQEDAKDYEHLQEMVEFYDDIVDDGLPYAVKSLAKNVSDCENKCQSQYMTYEDAQELVKTEAYDEWFNENYVKPISNLTSKQEDVKEDSPVEIIDIFETVSITGKDELNVVVKNNGTEAVKYFEAYAVFWDNNGYPVKANFGYDEVMGIMAENPNLTVGESTTWTWQPYVAGDDFGKAEVFISKVELYDGTVWEDSSASSKAVKRFSEVNK